VTGDADTISPGHIDIDNPFIPAAMRDADGDGVDDQAFIDGWTGDWDRRYFEVGNITTDNERTTWRTWAGLQGSLFDGNWDWDASVSYGHFEQMLIRSNEIDVRKEGQALDSEYAADGVTIQCADAAARAAGCVPLNLFGVGSITPEMADWIRYTPILNPTIKLVNVLAYMTGDIFEMPAGAVGAVFGVEYRQDEMNLVADDGSNYGGITYNIVPDISPTTAASPITLFLISAVMWMSPRCSRSFPSRWRTVSLWMFRCEPQTTVMKTSTQYSAIQLA